MNLDKRAYGLEPNFGIGPVLELSVPEKVWSWLYEAANISDYTCGEFEFLPYEHGRGIRREGVGFTINLEATVFRLQLKGLRSLLRLLNTTPEEFRLDEPQLIELSMTMGPDDCTIGGTVHPNLFEWCERNLGFGSALVAEGQRVSTSIADQTSEVRFGRGSKPESCVFMYSGGCVSLGRWGGNCGATIAWDSSLKQCRMVTHNVRSPFAVGLLLGQCAQLENLYRNT